MDQNSFGFKHAGHVFIDYSASLQDILISKIIYIGTFVLKKNYIALYHRLNDLINQFFHERYRDVHMLMEFDSFWSR